MADTTILGPKTTPFPFEFPAAVVSVKKAWTGDWIPEPRFQNVSFYTHVGSIGPGMASLPISYGTMMYQWQTAHATVSPHKYRNWWVKIDLATDEALVTQWVGRITDEQRSLLGSSDGQTGDQLWRAYSALYELDAFAVSTSYFNQDNTTPVLMDWIPPMNGRTRDGRILGNRSETKDKTNKVFMYGGTDQWTRKQYIEYLLKMYGEQSDGPTWKLTGQLDSLDEMTDMVEFNATQTLMEMIQLLIPPRLGLDFTVDYFSDTDSDGFEIRVFPLQHKDVEFGGATLPANEDVLRIQVGQTKDLIQAQVERSSGTTHNKIRLLGERIIVATTLYGDDYGSTLEPGWDTDTLQAEYLEATGSDSYRAAANDRFRNDLKFRDVYRKYVAVSDWVREVPIMNADGTLPEAIVYNTYQTIIKHTLNWLPLYDGYDYSANPATPYNSTIVEPEFMTPQLWFYAPTATVAGFTITGGHFPAMHIGQVLPLENDWGFYLNTESGLIVASGHNSLQRISSYTARYDYDKFIATIAVEADHRLTLEYDLGNDDDGTVFEMKVPGAELWLLAPRTAVGATTYNISTGNKIKYSPSTWVELRNDASRLAPLMAGLIARFQNDRARGRFVLEGYRPWAGLVGKILEAVEDAGDTYDIHGVVTSVSWANHRTAVKTGYR